MEDYGMCCGPNEAKQCIKEYNERLDEESKLERKENIKLLFCGALAALILVTIPLLITLFN